MKYILIMLLLCSCAKKEKPVTYDYSPIGMNMANPEPMYMQGMR